MPLHIQRTEAAEPVLNYRAAVLHFERFLSLGTQKEYSVLFLFLLWLVWAVALWKVKGLQSIGLSCDLGVVERMVSLFLSQSGLERLFSANRERQLISSHLKQRNYYRHL